MSNSNGGASRYIPETIKHKLALLPAKPGCYLMKNQEGAIIYVGKAKVLKNRVRSYFSGRTMPRHNGCLWMSMTSNILLQAIIWRR